MFSLFNPSFCVMWGVRERKFSKLVKHVRYVIWSCSFVIVMWSRKLDSETSELSVEPDQCSSWGESRTYTLYSSTDSGSENSRSRELSSASEVSEEVKFLWWEVQFLFLLSLHVSSVRPGREERKKTWLNLRSIKVKLYHSFSKHCQSLSTLPRCHTHFLPTRPPLKKRPHLPTRTLQIHLQNQLTHLKCQLILQVYL